MIQKQLRDSVTQEPTNHHLSPVRLTGTLENPAHTILTHHRQKDMQRTCRYHFASCESCPGLGLECSRQQAKSRTDGCSHLGNDLYLQGSPRAEPTRKTLHNNLETLVPPHFQPEEAQEFVITAWGNLPSESRSPKRKKVKVKWLSRVPLFVAPWTVAHQAPPSMGFSRQRHWRRLPFPPLRKNIALTMWIFVCKVVPLLFNILSSFVIAFLPRSKRLLISWLQSLSAVILEPKKIKSVTCLHFFPICLP